jgi:hypothetical protein
MRDTVLVLIGGILLIVTLIGWSGSGSPLDSVRQDPLGLGD